MEKHEVYEKHKQYLVPCVANYYKEPLILDRGKGKFLYDIDGKEYLDFFGGILTISVGHCDDEITSKVVEQIEETSTHIYFIPQCPDRHSRRKAGPYHSRQAAEIVLHQQWNRSDRNCDPHGRALYP